MRDLVLLATTVLLAIATGGNAQVHKKVLVTGRAVDEDGKPLAAVGTALCLTQTLRTVSALEAAKPVADGRFRVELPLQGQRIQRREHPGIYTVVRHNLGVSGDEEGVNLPDYRGLAVMSIFGFGGVDEEPNLFPWSAGGWIGHLGVTLVPREAQASPPGSVVGLTPIVWAIKT